MKKFEGMLFCTDLDGTLFSSDKTVSRENLEAIEYFKSEGGLFTFITGRVPQTAAAICRQIRPNAPYGCINGGGIFDPVENRYLWNTHLPDHAVELVREVDARLPEIGIQLNTEKEVYFCKESPAMVRFRKVSGLPLTFSPYEKVKEPVLKVLFAHDDEEQIAALARLLREHPKADDFDFIRSEKHLYEILPKGVNKGVALKKLAALLGVERKNTIAAGDYNNDVAMLREAGLSFAVANAVPEVKKEADYVTVSNDENAIAAIIEGLDRGRYSLGSSQKRTDR
ncbi:MAG: HAD family phosphatase [Clostridia bacterium]|nr:HAD family phosphatase [Clostridia bacterium]